MQHGITADEKSAQDPRPVTRGLKTQIGNIGIDSLYLVIEYPHIDLYENWSYPLQNEENPKLHEGILYDGMVLRNGAHGYKFSVWDGDARLFLTDRVNDKLDGTNAAGQGMGAMLQLGPKWLAKWGDVVNSKTLIKNIYAQLVGFGIWYPDEFYIRLNRLDIAVDVIGLAVADFSMDEWRRQWVGYASPKNFWLSNDTRQLETITIGSSSGAVMLRIYDKVAESIKSGTSVFWSSVWGLDELETPPVTRFEWAIKPYQGKFTDLWYLEDFTFERFLDLLNYASLKWGRLCIPQESGKNKQRWPLALLWEELRALIDDWSVNYDRFAGRDYDYTPDLNPEYLNAFTGWVAGLRARAGVHKGLDGPLPEDELPEFLINEGFGPGIVQTKAERKHKLISRLSGKGGNNEQG